MTSFFSRIVLALSAIALAVSVTASAGQAKKSTDLQTSKQVKALIASAKTPADHVKLQKHFLALAAKEARDLASAHEHMAAAK